MSLFKSQMFFEDAPVADLDLDGEVSAFGPSYGNRIASARRFRETWSARRRQASLHAVPAVDACCIASRRVP